MACLHLNVQEEVPQGQRYGSTARCLDCGARGFPIHADGSVETRSAEAAVTYARGIVPVQKWCEVCQMVHGVELQECYL